MKRLLATFIGVLAFISTTRSEINQHWVSPLVFHDVIYEYRSDKIKFIVLKDSTSWYRFFADAENSFNIVNIQASCRDAFFNGSGHPPTMPLLNIDQDNNGEVCYSVSGLFYGPDTSFFVDVVTGAIDWYCFGSIRFWGHIGSDSSLYFGVVGDPVYNNKLVLYRITAQGTGVFSMNDVSNLGIIKHKPNPFTSFTEISFTLLCEGFVSLEVYNQLGQKLETLIYERRKAGTYKYKWNSSKYPSGMYFYKIDVNGKTECYKMIHLK